MLRKDNNVKKDLNNDIISQFMYFFRLDILKQKFIRDIFISANNTT